MDHLPQGGLVLDDEDGLAFGWGVARRCGRSSVIMGRSSVAGMRMLTVRPRPGSEEMVRSPPAGGDDAVDGGQAEAGASTRGWICLEG